MRFLSSLLAAAALCAVAATSASASGWAVESASFPVPVTIQNREVAVDASGTVVVVWQATSGLDVVLKPPGGTFSAPQTLSTATAVNPQIALDGKGDALVVWQEQGTKIAAAERPAGGAFAGLGVITGNGVGPDAGFTSDGSAVVAWSQLNNVWASVRAPGQAAFAKPALVGSQGGPVDDLTVATHPGDDGAAVVWTTDATTTARVRSSYRATGGAWGPEQELEAFTDGGKVVRVRDLEAGLTKTGRVEAAWRDAATTGSGKSDNLLRAASRASGLAAPWTPAQTLDIAATDISDATTYRVDQPHVAPLDDGGARIVWTRGRGDGTFSQVRSVRRVSGAVAYGPIAPLAGSAAPATRLSYGAGVALPGNRVLATWTMGYDLTMALALGSDPFAFVSPAGGPVPGPDIDARLAAGGTSAVELVDRNQVFQVAFYDETPPELRDVAVPATGTAGQALAMSATPFDALTFADAPFWDFGDGGTASGPSASHAYAAPGTYTVTVETMDDSGNETIITRPVVVSAPGADVPPPPPPPPPPPAKRAEPVTVTGVRISPKTISRKRGGSFAYTLSASAKVTVVVARAACKPSKAKKKALPCARFATVRTLTAKGRAGANSLRLKVSRAMKPGAYRATVGARAPDGRTAVPVSVRFTIR
jgi:hypothetical protein